MAPRRERDEEASASCILPGLAGSVLCNWMYVADVRSRSPAFPKKSARASWLLCLCSTFCQVFLGTQPRCPCRFFPKTASVISRTPTYSLPRFCKETSLSKAEMLPDIGKLFSLPHTGPRSSLRNAKLRHQIIWTLALGRKTWQFEGNRWSTVKDGACTCLSVESPYASFSGGTLSCQQDYVPALRGARVCAPGRTLVWHILPGR